MGRSAAGILAQALGDSALSVGTLASSYRFGVSFYRRFLSLDSVRNQYVLPSPGNFER